MARVLKGIIVGLCMALALSGCGTSTRFILPEGARVYIPSKDMTYSNGKIKSRPFFWSSFSGIDYQVVKDGKTVSEGKLDSDFRVWSIFWPPLAIIYWPVGYECNCYDLTGAKPVQCGS